MVSTRPRPSTRFRPATRGRSERTNRPAPVVHPRVTLVAAGLDILGGHAVEARILIEALRGDGYAVDFLPITRRFPAGLRWVRRVRYARTILNEALYLMSLGKLRRADVVHVFSASYWSFLLAPAPAMLVARILGKHVVLHYHSGEAADHLARWRRRTHPFLRLAHEIVVPSKYLRDIFARYDYRVRVIPNVVDTSRFAYRARRRPRPRLLSTRNLEPHYRVDATLVAFALLRARYPDATLTVAGTGSQEGSLRWRAALLAGDAVRFVGRVEPADMPRLLDHCDVFVNSSVVDNQPVSILEAFAAGLPVVTTASGGIGEMVRDEVTGLIVPPSDPRAMARAIDRLLEEPARGAAMAERARAEVERHTWPQVRAAWAGVYRGSGGGNGAPRGMREDP